jgi:hypothetical protein
MYELYLSVFILQFVWKTMKKYKYYFCSFIDDSLEDIVDHCIDSHLKNTPKYRELELDERPGNSDIKHKFMLELFHQILKMMEKLSSFQKT